MTRLEISTFAHGTGFNGTLEPIDSAVSLV